jgi:hypothetical protein
MVAAVKLYRSITSDGWLTISGRDDSVDDIDLSGWRLATRREAIGRYLTAPRFSWLWLVSFLVLFNVAFALTRWWLL